MATEAIATDAAVIKRRVREIARVMARFALVVGLWMVE